MPLARALGYATKRDLDALYDALEAIERDAEAKEGSTGLFDGLADLFRTANRNSNAGKEPREG